MYSGFRIMYRELKEGESKADLNMKESTGTIQILNEWEAPRSNDPTACTVDHVLKLLQRLYALAMEQGVGNNKYGKQFCFDTYFGYNNWTLSLQEY